MDLFRKEALEYQGDRMHGEVLLQPTLHHGLLTALLLLWAVFAALWLSQSQFARKETVLGWLQAVEGVTPIYARREGLVRKVLVADGETVARGQALFIIGDEQVLSSGQRLQEQLLAELQLQRDALSAQRERLQDTYVLKGKELERRRIVAGEDLRLLAAQRVTLHQRHRLSQLQLQRFQALQRDGFVNPSSVEQLAAEELSFKSDLQLVERSYLQRANESEQLVNEQQLLPQELADKSDQLAHQLSALAGQIKQLEATRETVVTAPAAGVVYNLQFVAGQRAPANGVPLASLMPLNATLQAQLLVPARAAGFLAVGQAVDIRYEAFPYEKFGVQRGIIGTVSDVLLLPQQLLDAPVVVAEPVYRISAGLEKSSIEVYGRKLPLKAGMTLAADVRLSERSLLQWLLEPLYSLHGKMV